MSRNRDSLLSGSNEPSKVRQTLLETSNANRRPTVDSGKDFEPKRLTLQIRPQFREKLEVQKRYLVGACKAPGSKYKESIISAICVAIDLVELGMSELDIRDLKKCETTADIAQLVALGLGKIGLECNSEEELARMIARKQRELERHNEAR